MLGFTKKHSITIFITLSSMYSCKKRDFSDTKPREFSSTTLNGKKVDVTFNISQFNESQYRIERTEASAEQLQDPSIHRSALGQLFTHNVIFEKIDEQVFTRIKNTQWPENPLKFENRVYTLDEFLPPAMQALMDADFRDQDGYITAKGILAVPDAETRDKKLSRIAGGYFIRPNFSVRSNCWTTAYELLRKRENAFLHFFASDQAVLNYLGGEAGLTTQSPYSSFLKELTWEEACLSGTTKASKPCPADAAKNRNNSLQAGDLLIITSAGDRIEHAAIYLADDLFFERAGVRSGHLYRINTWSEIAKLYAPTQSTRAIFRRFGEANFKTLPNPQEVFGAYTREEKEVGSAIREDLRPFLKAVYQPGSGDRRDLAIYPYTDIAIEPLQSPKPLHTSGKTQYRLKPESQDPAFFVKHFEE